MSDRGHSGSKDYAKEIVAKALGRQLKGTELVHHVDCNPYNNEHSNLVVCPDRFYHWLMHIRQRAYDACGNANFRKCCICQQYTDPKLLYANQRGKGLQPQYWHRECKRARNLRKRA